MTSLSHALIGAAIASRIQNPYLAGTFAVVSHVACDAIPHWDLGTNWRNRPKWITGGIAIAENLISLFGVFFIFKSLVPNSWLLFLTILLSLIPDWLEAPYFIFMPHSPKLFYYLYKAQSSVHGRLKFPWGLLTQIVVVATFLWVGFIL